MTRNPVEEPHKQADKTSDITKTPDVIQGLLAAELLDSLDDGIGIWNPEDELVACNEKFNEARSAFPHFRIGHTYHAALLELAQTGQAKDAVGQEKQWVAAKLDERLAALGKEITHQTQDGKWVLSKDIRTADGGIFSIRRDISELKARELELASKTLDLDIVLDAMNDLSIAVLVRDKDLRYRFANKKFEELYGKSTKDVIGKTGIELFGEEVASGFDPGNLEVIKSGIPYQVDEKLKFPDGREIISNTMVRRIIGNDKKPYACITIEDVTEKRRQEKILDEKNRALYLVNNTINSLPIPILVKDGKMRYRILNSEFQKVLGKDEGELIGKTTEEVFGKERATKYDAKEQSVIESGEPIEFEETFSHADGSERSAFTKITRVIGEDGQRHAVVMITDVTEMKVREEKLKHLAREIDLHRQRMEHFAETSADWFWEMDGDLIYTFFSHGLVKTIGFTPEQLIGKTRRDVWRSLELTSDQIEHLDLMDRHLPIKDYVYKITNPVGKEFWISISASPRFDQDNKFIGYYGSGRDVTDQIEREEALIAARSAAEKVSAQNELFRTLLDSAPAAIYAKDANLRIIYGNSEWEKMSGSPFVDAVGKTDEEIFGEAGEALMQADLSVMKTGNSAENYEEAVKTDNSIQYRKSYKARFTGENSEQFLVGLTVDVTEQKEREAALETAQLKAESADRAKSEFLANMSHEIRTPMNGVMGMAELLAKTKLDAKQKMFTDVIVKSGSSLLTIINDILDFSKLDAGQMELDPAPFKLGEAIEDVATLISSRVAEKDLELIVRIDPALPEYMIGDVGRIRQIVINLMGNAVKFTDQGHVYVNVMALDRHDDLGRKWLRFEVEDTGIGIEKEKCQAVFEKFNQADTSASRKHEGTGLGLSIASSLVEIMDGQIGAVSVLGKGSTFWFEIPLPAHNEEKTMKKIPQDVTGARVLIIDDNPVNRSILGEQMAAWNFDSAACQSGADGLAVMRAAVSSNMSIECVVLDYHMPEMNGGEVVRQMRADPILAGIPVIMLTSVDQTEDGKAFSSLGIAAHLTKPARSSHLLETIIEVVSEHLHEKQALTLSDPDARGRIDQDTASAPTSREKHFPEHYSSLSQDDEVDILICEDNEVNQIVFTQIMLSLGYSFHIANNGAEGLAYVQSHQPALILMDVSMPKMNGLDATKHIRDFESESGRHTPIIGVTAHAIKGDMEKCLAAGMDDYVSKPVSPDRLGEKIRQWMPNTLTTRLAKN